MKVVQVLPALAGGGVEQGTLEMARALVGAGHRSVVVSAGGALVAELEAGGSEHVAWPIGRKHPATLLTVRRFRRWLAAERPDVLHARSRLPAWVCWLAWRGMAKAARPNFVTTVHGLYSVSAYSAVMTRGERVVAVSDVARRYVEQNYPNVDPRRLVRIYRGVDTARFHKSFEPSAQWRSEWARQHPELIGKRLITLPGRLTRLKGHHDFIDVMEQLRRQRDDVAGVVVGGEDPKRTAYASEIRQRAPWLTFTGQRADLREIMAVSCAVVSLSTHPESFGRAVLEALSLGTPVVGYDHGGVGEVLAKVYPQGRVERGDRQAVAAKLLTILDNESAARAAVKDHDFDTRRMCAETLSLYEELAAPGVAAPRQAAGGQAS